MVGESTHLTTERKAGYENIHFRIGALCDCNVHFA